MLFWTVKRTIRYLRSTVQEELATLYLPTAASVLVVVFALAFFYWRPGWQPHEIGLTDAWAWWKTPFPEKQGERALKIFEGLDLIVVAIVIFVAESVRDSANRDQRRVLLQVSYLWPLALAITLTPFGFLLGEFGGAFLALEAVLAAAALAALWRIIRNLLNVDSQRTNRKRLLKARIREAVLETVRERTAMNILAQSLGQDKDIKLHYVPGAGWLSKPQDYTLVTTTQSGWICDINLHELERLSAYLEDQARPLGFSLYGAPLIDAHATSRGAETRAANTQPLPTKKAFLLKRYGEQVDPKSNYSVRSLALFALPKELTSQPLLAERVGARIHEIFKFTDAETSSAIFRRELKFTKDELIAAIHDRALYSIDERRQIYIDVADQFLTTLGELGGRFSAEQADLERQNILQRWEILGWLQEDIRDLLSVAATTASQEVQRAVMSLPFVIATRALLMRDHLLFRRFLSFAPFIYHLAQQAQTPADTKTYLENRSWKFVTDLAELYLRPNFDENGAEPFAGGDYKDFCQQVFKVYLDLLKAAADRDEAKHFRTVLDAFDQLADHLLPKQPLSTIPYLKAALQQVESEVERARIRDELKKLTEAENTWSAVARYKQQVIFGLAAHMISRRLAAPQDSAVELMFSTIEERLPTDLAQLTIVFAGVSETDVSGIWGWDMWDFTPDGRVRFVDKSWFRNFGHGYKVDFGLPAT